VQLKQHIRKLTLGCVALASPFNFFNITGAAKAAHPKTLLLDVWLQPHPLAQSGE